MDNIPGTIEHMLLNCHALDEKRSLLYQFWERTTQESPNLQELLSNMKSAPTPKLVQFLLDPSVMSEVIHGCQNKAFSLEKVFQLTTVFIANDFKQ